MNGKIVFILLALLLCVISLTSCASGASKSPDSPSKKVGEGTETTAMNETDGYTEVTEFIAENRIDNTSSLSELLTDAYTIEELQVVFGHAATNVNDLSASIVSDARIAEVDARFPIECLRQTDSGALYSVYRVKEGGLYYVFWADVFDNSIAEEKISEKPPIVDRMVYFTAYFPTSPQLTSGDFSAIIPNASTAEDVSQIDSNFELCFLLSSNIVSWSLLEDGSVMQIRYDFDEKIESTADLIVTSKEIISGTNSFSKVASIFPNDLP